MTKKDVHEVEKQKEKRKVTKVFSVDTRSNPTEDELFDRVRNLIKKISKK